MSAELLPGLAVTVERDVPCRMRDGVVLRADVYRPAAGGTHPVVLIRLPYDKTSAESNVGYAHPSWYARHGYVVVAQDCRGRFASDGEWYPFRDEGSDGYDTIEWAARLPGANGKVGMYGFSYAGANQLLAARERPPSLAAICPGFTASQFYEGWTYVGGAFSLAFASSWATFLELEEARRRGDDALLGRLGGALLNAHQTYWTLPLRELSPVPRYYLDWLEHPTYDDYWRRWSIDESYELIEVPALHVGGWYDVFVSGTVANFAALRRLGRAPQKLVVGPWHHMPWAPLAGATADAGANAVDDWVLRFLDRHLKGVEDAALDSPVTAYVLGDGWRDLDDWPPTSASRSWYLHSGGRANSASGDGTLSQEPPADEPADVYVYEPGAPVMSVGGHSCCLEAIAPMGPACQREREAARTVLVYTSDPFDEPVEIVGHASLTLHAASSAVDTDFTARLCVVAADGCSTNLQEGIVRARCRESRERPTPIEPGRVYEYSLDLGPLAVRIDAGHRLRLDVTSSDFPQWDRNLNTGGPFGREAASAAVTATQIVLHDEAHASRLVLPLVG